MPDFSEKLARRSLYSHVREEEDGIPLLQYLCTHFTRRDEAGWKTQILAGNVLVNDKKREPADKLKKHDRVSYFPGEMPEPKAELHYQVVYEDPDLLVIDKPGNLCVHPTGPFFRHTLWHLVGSRYGEIMFINRLDRETSGLLIAARNPETAAKMDNRNTPVHKEYLAIVQGHFHGVKRFQGKLIHDESSTVAKKKKFISGPIDPSDIHFADTEIREEQQIPPDMSLVRAILFTGRQHQIRATLYSAGFPIAGDKLYGPDERLFLKIPTQSFTQEDMKLLKTPRQALHSALLEFIHPVTGKRIHCESPVQGPELIKDLFPKS